MTRDVREPQHIACMHAYACAATSADVRPTELRGGAQTVGVCAENPPEGHPGNSGALPPPGPRTAHRPSAEATPSSTALERAASPSAAAATHRRSHWQYVTGENHDCRA